MTIGFTGGHHIVEFEQNGEDRAKYRQRLVDDLADALNIAGLSGRNLKLFRQFYLSYPQIVQTASAQFEDMSFIKLNDLPRKLRKAIDVVM